MPNVACPARTKAWMCTVADCTNVKPNYCKTPCKLQLFCSVNFTNYKLLWKTSFKFILSADFVSHVNTYITALVDILIVAQMIYRCKVSF